MAQREIPVDFLNSLNPKVLPRTFGNNWEDPAFRRNHNKPQSITNEFSGKKRNVTDPTQRSPRRTNGGSSSGFEGSSSGSGVVPASITARSAHQLIESRVAAQEGRSDLLSHATYATLDDKVLRFFAYVTESVRESATEAIRHRRLTITYFPADDSLLIQEPHLPNSGLPGGTILKRQRVPTNPRQREALPEQEVVTLDHLRVGESVMIHSTIYNVYACDARTRSILEEMGIPAGPDSLPPQDNYAKKLDATLSVTASNSFGVKSQDRTIDDVIRTQRYIQDSGKVLFFHAITDERSEGGRIRNVDLNLFIEDDTISVTERQNTAEAVPAAFLSRRRLPKNGKMEKTVELTFAHRVNGMRETDLGSPSAYYGPLDLDIGTYVNVFGRQVLLCDCDDFTRDYYASQFGIELAPPIDISTVAAQQVAITKANRPILPTPPYTGYGTYEDSLSSCKSLALKAPKGNLINPHSRVDVLRFQMRLHKPERLEDAGRVFVLSYNVEDGEITVAETALRNSGFVGGKFCRKQRLVKSFDGVQPTFYTLADLKVGAVLNINQFIFEIVTCDLHTENHLAHPTTNGVAPDVAVRIPKERVLSLLTALRGFVTVRYVTQTEAFRAFDRDRDGNVTLAELHDGLKSHLITDKQEDAVALFHQLASNAASGRITHNDFFTWLAAPVSVKNIPDGDVLDTTQSVGTLVDASLTESTLQARNAVLRSLKEKLEARCLNGFEMFRMSSTMPRAYKGRRSDIQSLANTDKDSVISPVQLHRCVDEVLGLGYTDQEIRLLLEYFFPNVSESDRLRRSDVGLYNARVELKEFQDRFNEMTRIGQL
ncbi:Hypothetical protein, putative [Bodo saltans]|uniref:EF-hand domain-containing family member C2 n=1 Tax=Bodo saltans TaxID=75058 RepID=A0A0S4IJW8_BODSA|nr:Hypothetical protein, putative [Bodo saltans]|eukprot:CUE96249.1 Hypothetical protein, putative [Bodo saltans]